MANLLEEVRKVAEGQPTEAPLKVVWAIHEGMRGATWLTVQGDGKVLERQMRGQLGPLKELGTIPASAVQELAATLVSQGFDQLKGPEPAAGSVQVQLSVTVGEERFGFALASFQLQSHPAMNAIGQAFMKVRSQVQT